ncbi:FimV/HubP family polar landmark protein [Motiliproteus sp.]|uniref:FimV/HubP family polar landmark protein n=1 Tax=Motiliproteus sp. TaxID=1898955 RepID=UPI003BAD95A0
MEKYVIELGELDVFIMGKNLPLRNLPYHLQEQIVLNLSKILAHNLEETYGGAFSFNVISVEDGCIKGKLFVTWTLVAGIAGAVIAYPGLKAGAQELWNDGNAVIEYFVEGRACEARFEGLDFINGLYGPVKKGDNLNKIASSFDCGDVTKEQIMVAIFHENPDAFPSKNMNLILEGQMLVIPRDKVLTKINASDALKLVNEHTKEK